MSARAGMSSKSPLRKSRGGGLSVIEKIAGEGDASASILYKDGKRTATASGQRMSPQFTDVLPRYYCALARQVVHES